MVTSKYSMFLISLLCGHILLNSSPANGAANTKGRRTKPKPKRRNSISPECSKNMIEYAPVCGSDGKAYMNINWVKCIQSGTPSSDLHQVDASKCKDWAEVTTKMKKILDELAKTKKELANNHRIKKNTGRRLIKRQGCKVTYNIQPACASDGNMYPNPSYLRCAQNRNPDLHEVDPLFCEERPEINTNEYGRHVETRSAEFFGSDF